MIFLWKILENDGFFHGFSMVFPWFSMVFPLKPWNLSLAMDVFFLTLIGAFPLTNWTCSITFGCERG